jgi:hypothetical protein
MWYMNKWQTQHTNTAARCDSVVHSGVESDKCDGKKSIRNRTKLINGVSNEGANVVSAKHFVSVAFADAKFSIHQSHHSIVSLTAKGVSE